jgi:hypothetical protein
MFAGQLFREQAALSQALTSPHLIGREKGSELDSPPSTAKA